MSNRLPEEDMPNQQAAHTQKNQPEENPMERMATSYDTYMKVITLGR